MTSVRSGSGLRRERRLERPEGTVRMGADRGEREGTEGTEGTGRGFCRAGRGPEAAGGPGAGERGGARGDRGAGRGGGVCEGRDGRGCPLSVSRRVPLSPCPLSVSASPQGPHPLLFPLPSSVSVPKTPPRSPSSVPVPSLAVPLRTLSRRPSACPHVPTLCRCH